MASTIHETLVELGLDIVSIIPPGSAMAPSSRIVPSALGKAPGVQYGPSGLWGGYDWLSHHVTIDDARQWAASGSGIGLKAGRFPAVDIDVLDADLASAIESITVGVLGEAPVRYGRAPKRLLMYRARPGAVLTRRRLWLRLYGETHLVEVLGEGQQYVVHGTHPSTMQPYRWEGLSAGVPWYESLNDLFEIDDEYVSLLFSKIQEHVARLGGEWEVQNLSSRAAGLVEQSTLEAPSIEALEELVDALPNSNARFPSRDDYIKVGIAIRAACGTEEERGLNAFLVWAMKWEGNAKNPRGNAQATVAADWDRFRPPFAIGWSWLEDTARALGALPGAAADAFGILDTPPTPPTLAPRTSDPDALVAPLYSDQWLADEVIRLRRGTLRYVPQRGEWLSWDGARWRVDALLLAESAAISALRELSDKTLRVGVTPAQQRESIKRAAIWCSASKVPSVLSLMRSSRAIAVSHEVLDADPMALNTPVGLLDLTTGTLGPADADRLCTRMTQVPAQQDGQCPQWMRFLDQVTNGNVELQRYLQRWAGYCLTGSTQEQQLLFLWGDGGNGKGVFLRTLAGLMGDYAITARSDLFTAGRGEKHPTDVAMLAGARLVIAHEAKTGSQWDEVQLKTLTGGDVLTARFMYHDNFTFVPTFKIALSANARPEFRAVGQSMRRRMHLVTFNYRPTVVDTALEERLKSEWPAILGWAVAGCLAWQAEGLGVPDSIRDDTSDYLEDEDALSQWLEDECIADPEAVTSALELFRSWQQWAHAHGEFVGSHKRLSGALTGRGYSKWRSAKMRGFRGLALRDPHGFGQLAVLSAG